DLRSARMIAKYEQLRASEGIDPQVSAMLADEKQRQLDLERRLQEALADTLASGEVIFRGVTWDGSALGDNLSRAVNALLDRTVPELYPKLEMGARTVTGKEAEEILKAANLNALPQVYYDPPMGLGLVRSDAAGRKAIDEEAEIAREVLAYLRQQHSYGEKVTGRLLENHFTGLGYGWNPDVLHIVLAALLRAGAIEVSYQGRRYRNHIDPLVRQPFSGTQAFRSAGFAPREKVDLKSLVRAAENLESLTGEDVDIEEEAIAGRLKALARQELEGIGPALARINANKLPRSEVLTEYRDALRAIVEAAPDDCVRTLAGEGKTLRDERDQVRAIEDAVSDAELPKLLGASRALHELLPELRRRGLSAEVAEAGGRLEALFNGGEVYSRPGELVGLALRIRGAYEQLYANLHAERLQVYEAAIQELAERPEWRELEGLDDDSRLATLREAILADLKRRACDSRAINPETERCRACHAGLGQLESDIEAIGGLRQRALEQLWKAVEPEAPDTPSKRLRAVDYVHGPIASEEDLNAFLERLKAEIIAALRAGGRVILE
ncbi:MAG TPA: hypothetical protein VFU72_03735, partial [Nitrolancea sp.]|nr:hypothetical protein [Nitrolancea sp.]